MRWVETVTDRRGTTLVVTPEWVSGAREGRPEKLVRRLRGDLDNIVLKAMKKEPAKRYESAGQMAEDVRRHLESEPVIARKDTVLYRASKFGARHRTAVVAAAAVLATMVAGGALTVSEWRVARQERGRAERRFNDVRHLATSFLFEFHDAIRDLPGSTEARSLVVRKALSYLDSLAGESQGDASLQRELAEAYERVADVQGNPAQANLGDTAGAARSTEKALALRETLAREHPESVEDKMALATTYGSMGAKFGQAGNAPRALEQYQKAFRMREEVYAAHPGDLKIKRSLAVGYWEIGVGFADLGSLRGRSQCPPQIAQLVRRTGAGPIDARKPAQRRAGAQEHLGYAESLGAGRRSAGPRARGGGY